MGSCHVLSVKGNQTDCHLLGFLAAGEGWNSCLDQVRAVLPTSAGKTLYPLLSLLDMPCLFPEPPIFWLFPWARKARKELLGGKISKDSTILERITTTTMPATCECRESGVTEAGSREELGRKFENLSLLKGGGGLSVQLRAREGFIWLSRGWKRKQEWAGNSC